MTNGRLLVLVAYDITDPKRLARVRRHIMPFAISGQKSFYECWVTPTELNFLGPDLFKLIDVCTDKVHFFELHESEFTLFLGEARRQSTEPFLIL